MVSTGTENLVVRAGWFGTRVYQGTPEFVTPTGGTAETFVRLEVGAFRPKYAIVCQAEKVTKNTDGVVTGVDIKKAYVDLSRIIGKDATTNKPIYANYVKLFIDGVDSSTTADGVTYTVLLME